MAKRLEDMSDAELDALYSKAASPPAPDTNKPLESMSDAEIDALHSQAVGAKGGDGGWNLATPDINTLKAFSKTAADIPLVGHYPETAAAVKNAFSKGMLSAPSAEDIRNEQELMQQQQSASKAGTLAGGVAGIAASAALSPELRLFGGAARLAEEAPLVSKILGGVGKVADPALTGAAYGAAGAAQPGQNLENVGKAASAGGLIGGGAGIASLLLPKLGGGAKWGLGKVSGLSSEEASQYARNSKIIDQMAKDRVQNPGKLEEYFAGLAQKAKEDLGSYSEALNQQLMEKGSGKTIRVRPKEILDAGGETAKEMQRIIDASQGTKTVQEGIPGAIGHMGEPLFPPKQVSKGIPDTMDLTFYQGKRLERLAGSEGVVQTPTSLNQPSTTAINKKALKVNRNLAKATDSVIGKDAEPIREELKQNVRASKLVDRASKEPEKLVSKGNLKKDSVVERISKVSGDDVGEAVKNYAVAKKIVKGKDSGGLYQAVTKKVVEPLARTGVKGLESVSGAGKAINSSIVPSSIPISGQVGKKYKQ